MVSVLLAVALATGATSKTEVSPVQKVVELLAELKGKVEADLAADEKLSSDYTRYCDEESNARGDAITSGSRTVNDLSAVIQEASASIATLTSEVEQLAGKISTAEADLKESTGIRQKENQDFAAAEADLVDTIDTLSRATIVLKRGQTSFLQRGSKDLTMLSVALSKIIEANWVTSHQKDQVQSLLQSSTEDADEDLSLAPQATAAAFESQGGGILDTLKDMNEKAEATLSEARKNEMGAAHAYEMLKQSLETELSTMNKRMSTAGQEKSGTTEAKESAAMDKATTKTTVAADTKFLAELKESCSAKAAQWAERQASAAGEIGAIEKAKEVLESGVTAFLQIKTTSTDEIDRRAQVADIVRKLAVKDHGYALSQLAAAAQSDPFGKVRGLIESMIDRLAKEAAEEADAKSFCDSETSKSKAKQAELTASLDQHNARIEKGTASKAQLSKEIKALQSQIAEMDAAQAEATSLRNKEHDEYLKSSKDFKGSAEAVASAIQVLSDYYSGSFLQVSSTQAPEFGGAKTDVAGTIMELLEVAESDFTKLLAEAEAGESSGKAAYDKLLQENKVTKAASTQEIAGKEGEVKQLTMSLLNYKEDQATTAKELDAVLAYLDKLKPQCETKVMSYAERKARREEEINGLKEALEILSR